tara:strand:- start:17767 stop:18447 length:681 start_codon:yes stop_codon:yes gene_type:complete
MMRPVYDITKFTMLDYPHKTACILWFAGCNMRCGYCHNPDILRAKGGVSEEAVLSFLETRKNKLEGVVLSGGECTGYPYLIDFARRIKALGFQIKMDTNGTKPETVKKMMAEGLIDYVALDYKAPQDKFYEITKSRKYSQFFETLSHLCSQDAVPFEIRTTVHTHLLNETDVAGMMQTLEALKYKGTYYLQNYRHGKTEGSLTPQNRTLNCNVVDRKGYNVEYRNF